MMEYNELGCLAELYGVIQLLTGVDPTRRYAKLLTEEEWQEVEGLLSLLENWMREDHWPGGDAYVEMSATLGRIHRGLYRRWQDSGNGKGGTL